MAYAANSHGPTLEGGHAPWSCHMVGGLWPLYHGRPFLRRAVKPSRLLPPHRHLLALSFPRPPLSEVRLETGSGRLLWLQVTLLLILEQELLLLFKALNIHTGWRGSGLLPSPPPRNRELGAQALPGIGHGPPWQSWVTGKCPSSAGLQAAQTMLGCPGLWPPKTKRGWETALRDPFIPGAGPAAQPWPCAGCPGLRPLGLPDAW